MQPTFCFNLTHIFSKIFEQINWQFLIITSNPTIVMVFYIFQLTNYVYYYNGLFSLRMSFCYHNLENLALFPMTITCITQNNTHCIQAMYSSHHSLISLFTILDPSSTYYFHFCHEKIFVQHANKETFPLLTFFDWIPWLRIKA
jgi:hypothetical protein